MPPQHLFLISRKPIGKHFLFLFCRSLLISIFILSPTGFVLADTAAPEPEGDAIRVDSMLDDTEENGSCTLREAILAANSDKAVDDCSAGNGDDTIRIPAGTVVLEIPGAGEDEGLTGDLDITESLTIVGDGSESTFINGSALDRVFHVVSDAAEVQFVDLAIKNGAASCGGGIFNNQGNLVLKRVLMLENHAPASLLPACASGGAIYNLGSLSISEAKFLHNGAEERGGAIYNEGQLLMDGSIVLENSGYDGGAVYTTGTGQVTDSFFLYNQGMGAGAIFNLGDLTLTRAIIGNNRAQLDFGGGIRQLGSLTMTDSTVRENVAWQSGGGISVEGGVTDVRNSVVSANRAEIGPGGGIYQSAGDLLLTNSSLAYNETNGSGGGLALLSGSAGLHNATVTQNTAALDDPNRTSSGGGVFVQDGIVSIGNSILALNLDQSEDPVNPDCSAPPGAIQSEGHNLVGQAEGCNWEQARGDLIGGLTSPINPELTDMADYGGPTLSIGLLPDSPAIDAGDGEICPQTDQRGVSRPQDGNGDNQSACDIGAFESDQ